MMYIYLSIIGVILVVITKIYFKGGANPHRKNLKDHTVLITGGNAGIGQETAKVLSEMGAHVILACRNMKSANEAKKTVIAYSKNENVSTVELDLCSFESIVNCVKELKERKTKIDILINNAGVMASPYMKTKDGLELQVGTNYIGPFYFTNLLLDNDLMNTEEGRIVNLSSNAHNMGVDIDVDNLFLKEENYGRMKAYGHSKMATILFTFEMQKKFDEHHINMITTCVHPGAVKTDLGRFTPISFLQKVLYPVFWLFFKTPMQGAQTSLYCALAPGIKGGVYYADCKEKKSVLPSDYEDKAKRLWVKTEEIINYECRLLK